MIVVPNFTQVDNEALVFNAERKTADIRDISLPASTPNEILVRVEAVSINLVDPLYVVHPLATSVRTIGRDFAGRVEALGAQVPLTNISRGDRAADFLQGACSINSRPGAFAE